MSLWLRADRGVTLDNLGVIGWADQSDSANNMFRIATDAAAPLQVDNAIGGEAALRFLGENRLRLNDELALTDFTLFLVGRGRAASPSIQVILGPGSVNQQLRYRSPEQMEVVGPGFTLTPLSADLDVMSDHSFVVQRGDAWNIFINGEPSASLPSLSNDPYILGTLGGWFDKFWLYADIAELVVYDRVLDPEERTAVQEYLDVRYDLP